MRSKSYFFEDRAKPEEIAVFGEARLVRNLDGKWELRGGSAEDRKEAVEWVRQFMKDALKDMQES